MVKAALILTVVTMAHVADLNAAAIQYSYDSLSRITRVAYPDGTTIAYTYDAASNRLSQVISSPSIPLPNIGIDKTSLTFSAAAGQTAATQIIVIRNGGGGSLQWDAVATASWLSVTPGSGTNSGAVNVTASAAGMSAGTYNGNVMILASASNAPLTVPVILTVTEAHGNPTISSGGIVSAAGSSPGIARGSVASLFGTALADAPATAETVPLPRTLSKVQVSVNDVNAPLWYVDSGQINFQVPFEAPLQGQASVVVTRDGAPSAPMAITLTPYAPSVFMYQPVAGVFDPIIVHAKSNELVTPTSPAVPGEYVVVYGTGIGDLTVLPATGALSPEDPQSKAKLTPKITIGAVDAAVTFAGLEPDGIGVAVFVVQIPSGLPSGSTAALVINFNGATSPPVNLAIGSGLAKTETFTSLSAWNAATNAVTTINFEGVAANGGAVDIALPAGLTRSGVGFTIDPAESNGSLFVLGQGFTYPDASVLSTQRSTTTNNNVVITLPGEFTSVGFILATNGAPATIKLSTGETITIPLQPIPRLSFFGLTTSQPITTLEITNGFPNGIDIQSFLFGSAIR